MFIPIQCTSCGRRAKIDALAVTALRCTCGSTALDLDESAPASNRVGFAQTFSTDGRTSIYEWAMTQAAAGVSRIDALTLMAEEGIARINGWTDHEAAEVVRSAYQQGGNWASKHTAEAIDTSSSAYSSSWSGQHWDIIQEEREGMCLWTVRTGGRPKTGGNYDVGLREAVQQVRAELDARGLPGEPERILPPDREESWITSSKQGTGRVAFVDGSIWSVDRVYGFTYREYTTWGLEGRVDPVVDGYSWQVLEPASFLHLNGEQKVLHSGTAPTMAHAQAEADRAATAVEKAGSRRTAAPSASEGLGQPVTGDCPRCGSGTYRGDLNYCPQCQLGGPGDPSLGKDSFASKQGTGRTSSLELTANWDPAQSSDPHNPYASIRAYTYTGPIENRPIDGAADGIRCIAPGCSWSTTDREAHENPRRMGGEPMVNAWIEHAIEKMNEKYGGNVAAS